ncbi:MAG: GNAT family N-acetyltransferase [Lacipirellulaceae bacterium]
MPRHADRRADVGIATPEERREALGLALDPVPVEARGTLVEAAGRVTGPLDVFAALAVYRVAGRVVAAAWGQPQPGSGAGLWPPAGAGCTVAAADALMRVVNGALDTASIGMTQALFEVDDDPRIAVVERHGYRQLAELLYLGRSVPQHRRDRRPDDRGIAFEPYAESDYARLKRVVEATYVGSLDCPGIEGVRSLDDVLAGYRATGRFNPESWRFAVVEGRDAGVVLVTPHDESDQAELVYMGLAPWARGRGLGAVLIDQALLRGALEGADFLMAAVDAANTPARRLYEAAGFAPWSRRFVYIRTCPDTPRVET